MDNLQSEERHASPSPAPPAIEPRGETVATALSETELGQLDKVWPIRGFRNRSSYIRDVVLQDIRTVLGSEAA